MSAWNSNGHTTRVATGTTDTVLFTDDVVIYTATSAKAVAIMSASNASLQKGKVFRFTNTGAGAVTLTPASGQIDGGATKVIAAGGTAISCLTLISDGTMWRTISYTTGS
jgi:hypothetical protein